jgi:hypothetical protein
MQPLCLTPANYRASAPASPPSSPARRLGGGEARPRRLRHDRVVDIAALSGDEGRQGRTRKLVRGDFRRAEVLER